MSLWWFKKDTQVEQEHDKVLDRLESVTDRLERFAELLEQKLGSDDMQSETEDDSEQ